MDAVVLGVSGLVGRAVAAELAAAGWQVTGTGRRADHFPAALADTGVRFVESDRHDPTALRGVLGAGADLVVDCLCYSAEHARQVTAHRAGLGHVVMISSKAVYVDDRGRHSNSADPPRFDGPVDETQPVMAPDGSGDYDSPEGYGANKVAAEIELLRPGSPVTILRPSRIHGPGGVRPREWFFVRRLLDGRPRVALAHGGRTANHPTAARNIASLVRACASVPDTRVLNVADPGHPTAHDIGRAVRDAARLPLDLVGLADAAPAGLGCNPWDTWPPYLLDTTAASRVPGYAPVSYADAVRDSVDDLLSLSAERRAALDGDPYFARLFDYAADDRALAWTPSGTPG